MARVGVRVADALDCAHRSGVLYRDVQPSNLLLDLGGTVWVADFGLVKADGAEDLTYTGDVLGKIRYMSPAGFRRAGAAPADPAGDDRRPAPAAGLRLRPSPGTMPR